MTSLSDCNWKIVAKQIGNIYRAVDRLKKLFPGRRFTPDGHLVGSIGEVLAAYVFDLNLETASKKGFDAIAQDGRMVEIKLTQGKAVALRDEPEHLIVLQRQKGEKTKLVYNGPGAPVWSESGERQKNGQRQIGVSKLEQLNEQVSESARLPVVRQMPI